MAKLKTLNLSDEVVQEIEKEQNHSKRADDLIRKGLLYEQGSNGSLEGLVAVIQQACNGLLNIEHVCTCKQEAKEEVKKPTPKTTKKETIKEAPQTVEPIKEVKEEETFNVDIPSVYQTEHFKGVIIESLVADDGNVVTKGGDILHLCTVNDEAIIVCRVDEHKVAYYFDEFADDYKGKEVYEEKANHYNFLKEWGLVD